MKTLIVASIFFLMGVILVSQNSSVEQYKYDTSGRLIEVIYNDSIQINYEYDLSGNMTSRSVQLSIPTGVDLHKEETLWTLYPNPSTNIVQIESIPHTRPQQIEIIDITGKVVYKKNLLLAGSNSIAINDLLPGIYVVKLRSQERFETHKLTKL